MANLADHWQNALNQQKSKLHGTKHSHLVKSYLDGPVDPTALVEILESKNEDYGKLWLPRYANRLGPHLQEFGGFVRCITTLVEGGGPIAAFIWGSIQALIEVASRFGSLLDSITQMLAELSQLMPQLSTYSALFPGRKALDRCIESLIHDYAGFCVEAIIFFGKCPISVVCRIFWFSLESRFKKHKERINQNLQFFSAERTRLVHQDVVMTTRKIAERQERLQDLLPPPPPVTMIEPDTLYIVPFERNPGFCDRDGVLARLHGNMTDPHHQRACLIHGTGGVGKTQLAIEYTYRYRSDYDYIVWVTAETDSDLANGFSGFAKRLGLDVGRDGTGKASVEAARTWFEDTKRKWLLVFDNAAQLKEMRKYRPCCTNGSILVTSQFSEPSLVVNFDLNLGPLSDAQGAALLLDQVQTLQDSSQTRRDAESLSAALGGLPLAIVHVAGYIRQSWTDLPQFIRLFEENRQNVAHIFAEDGGLVQYNKSLSVVHKMAREELDENSLKLVQIMSMLSPDGIPREMFSAGEHEDEPSLRFLRGHGVASLNEMIRKLTSRHLIETRDFGHRQEFFIHRSLQLSLLHELDNSPDTFQATFDMAVRLTRLMFPGQSPVQFPQNHLWAQCQKYSVHAMAILRVLLASARAPECSIKFGLLLSDVSTHLYERNIFEDALKASKAAEQISARFAGSEEAIRADIHTMAGAVRDTYGISKRSETLYQYEMAVALRQQHLDKMNKTDPAAITQQHIWNYANAWGNMTPILLDYECYQDVILYADLAIAIKQRLLESHDEFVFAAFEQNRNRHIALAALGQSEEAALWVPDPWNYGQRADLAVVMIRYHFFHANIAMARGNLETAHESLRRTLEAQEKVFGPHGRSTLDTNYVLGVLELRGNNLDSAERYLRKCLERPDDWVEECCARAKYRLGQILLLKNQDAEARTLLAEASSARAQFWQNHAGYWPPDMPMPDEDAIYDHIVPAEAGRPAMKALLPSSAITPNLNVIARQLLDRLGAKDGVCTPRELAEILRIDGPLPVTNRFVQGPR